MIQEELSGEIIGAGMVVLNELRPGLFMPEPYPCYPCNPWFVRDFDQIVASLAPKENAENSKK